MEKSWLVLSIIFTIMWHEFIWILLNVILVDLQLAITRKEKLPVYLDSYPVSGIIFPQASTFSSYKTEHNVASFQSGMDIQWTADCSFWNIIVHGWSCRFVIS